MLPCSRHSRVTEKLPVRREVGDPIWGLTCNVDLLPLDPCGSACLPSPGLSRVMLNNRDPNPVPRLLGMLCPGCLSQILPLALR